MMPRLADMHVHLPEMHLVDSALKVNLCGGLTHLKMMNSELDQISLLQRINDATISLDPQIFTSFTITRKNQWTEPQLDSLMISIKSQGYRLNK
jgi:hypothetical protein